MIGPMEPDDIADVEFVPQAVLKRPPAFFATHGIRFRSGLDDLNHYVVAELRLDRQPFALMRHDGTPEDETELFLPDTVPVQDIRRFSIGSWRRLACWR